MTMTLSRTRPAPAHDTTLLFLTPREVADDLGVSTRELHAWRESDAGPQYSTIGDRTIRYWRILYLEWKKEHRG